MTWRDRLVAMEADVPIDAVAARIADSYQNRYPVYSGSLDAILGHQ